MALYGSRRLGVPFLSLGSKEYVARVRLGTETDTLDADVSPIRTHKYSNCRYYSSFRSCIQVQEMPFCEGSGGPMPSLLHGSLRACTFAGRGKAPASLGTRNAHQIGRGCCVIQGAISATASSLFRCRTSSTVGSSIAHALL